MAVAKWLVGALIAATPASAMACSCIWFFTSVEVAELRAAAARVDTIVVGEVVGETTKSACRGAIGVAAPVYRTIRVDRTIKGTPASSLTVHVGEVTPQAGGCAQMVTSCDVRPGLGAKGVWALDRSGTDWVFSGVCAADAVRRLAVLDRHIGEGGAGGEIDSVRRHERSKAGPAPQHRH